MSDSFRRVEAAGRSRTLQSVRELLRPVCRLAGERAGVLPAGRGERRQAGCKVFGGGRSVVGPGRPESRGTGLESCGAGSEALEHVLAGLRSAGGDFGEIGLEARHLGTELRLGLLEALDRPAGAGTGIGVACAASVVALAGAASVGAFPSSEPQPRAATTMKAATKAAAKQRVTMRFELTIRLPVPFPMLRPSVAARRT